MRCHLRNRKGKGDSQLIKLTDDVGRWYFDKGESLHIQKGSTGLIGPNTGGDERRGGGTHHSGWRVRGATRQHDRRLGCPSLGRAEKRLW